MTTEATAILDGGDGGAPAAHAANGGGAAPAPNGSQPDAPWYAGTGYTDDDRVYIENKGWHKGDAVPAPVLKSYRELERIMGNKANAVILPKADDAKGKTELMQKLGMPIEAKDYTLPATLTPDKAQNLDAKLVEQYRGWAFKAHLTNEQFGTLLAEHEAAVEAAENASIDRYNADVARTKEKLTVEMGDGFGEGVARGNLAMRQLGISPDERDKISDAIGVEKATRMLMNVGGFLAQHKAVGLDNGGKPADSFVTDKARAASRMAAIRRATSGPDFDFRTSLMDPSKPDHRSVDAQWREWQRIANSK